MFGDMTLREILDEVIAKKGPYAQDQLTHAENVINYASQAALEIKKRLEQKKINLDQKVE